ncbi:cytochrome c-552 precursor [mine drainage metagenome]|uniref:Cytochrome c-552 n=1 Tax=mine drainage metagenome TaxID=410659 RepID=A0A1J5Q263_9ZZZZ
MKKLILSATTALVVAFAGSAFAADISPAAVKTADNVCSKCHGAGGATTSPLFPRLAGQQAGYIEQELKLFRDRGRGDPHAQAYMWGIAGPMSDQQIKELAVYFANQPPAPGQAVSDKELAAKGKALFQNGDDSHGIPACASCHGKMAEGNDTVPRLAGQSSDYLMGQLEAFRSKLRENDTMDTNAQSLSNDQIKALAAYLSSL